MVAIPARVWASPARSQREGRKSPPAHSSTTRSSARRALPRYPLPVLRLARLAVDLQAQGQGLGAQLLRFVLQLAMRMAGDFGCVGVVVDAKRGAVEFYAKHGFLALEAVHGQSEARPRPTAMFLAMRVIREASAGRSRR